jgi:ubiquinone/menaquinone biosynthesis C-methylase UbiE
MQSDQFDLQLDREAIASIIEPYVAESMPVVDKRWQDTVNHTSREQLYRLWRRRFIGGLVSRFRRTQRSVESCYSKQWREHLIDDQLSVTGKMVPLQWGETGYMARAISTKRVFLAYMAQIIGALGPGSVLEVGAGNGVNLLLLAARFPQVDFTGVELTQGGVYASHQAQDSDVLAPALHSFAPFDIVDPSAHRRVKFDVGNAANLKHQDDSFDLCYTVLALEQMEEIRDAALREICRVAKKWVVMIEPFSNWNSDGPRRNYVMANDYFRASVESLEKYGLEVVFSNADTPHKLTLKPGVVVARLK